MEMINQIHQAADYIKARINIKPTVALILGSGLGDIVDVLEDRTLIPY